jgi:hypothetical protein
MPHVVSDAGKRLVTAPYRSAAIAWRWNYRRHGGLRRLRLIEFNAVSTIVLVAVEHGIASRQQRFNRNRRNRGRHALPE